MEQKQITLLLFLREEDYGRRFLRFINVKKNPWIHPELVTEREGVLRRVCTESNRLVIVTDDSTICEDEKREVVLLTGEQNRKEKKIFQYQSAESIYKELTALLGVKESNPERMKEGQGIVMFFSPEGLPMTELAVLMAQYLGCQGRCLYISLSGFPVYYGGEFEKKPDYQTPGLGELLLCPAEELFTHKLQQLVHPFGSAEMLAPFSHYKDLLDCRAEDWQIFLTRLQKEGGYDSVIVETGALFETLSDLLELSDRLFLVGGEDDFGKVRIERFRHYCRMENKEPLLSLAEFIQIPEEVQEWRKFLVLQPLSEWAENRQVMGKMQNLLESRKEDDDVCLWEDFE